MPRRYSLLVVLLVLFPVSTARAQSRVVRAHKTSDRIVVDGMLNDAIWISAAPETEFTQRDPDEGKPPSERTELRIAYDDTNVYFGLKLFDREPSKIVPRLSRRDDDANADNITIQLSPYNDRLTGAVFELSAAGVQRDATISNDTNTDYSWEGVWESAVRITDDGWNAEIRIPFSQLRFPKLDKQVWGINVARFIHRKNETVWLRLVPKDENGLASRMLNLEGIDGVEPHRHLDLMPYIANRAEFIQPPTPNNPFNDGSRQFASTGIDIKYGITSNVTLDATVNPDFGQVEVDPAVVNLSAFETFFPEKRPFFLEGSNIFDNFGRGGANNFFGFNRNEPNLFYSRRIGRAPQGYANADFVDQPGATTILGAAKLTGKTSSGWTFGLIEAATSREYAKTITGTQRGKTEVEPLTNYAAARVLREKGRGGAGFLVTAVQRDLRNAALRDQLTSRSTMVGGDGYLFLDAKRDWVVHGKLAGSFVRGSASAIDALQLSPQRYYQRPDATHVRFQPGLTSMRGWTGSANLNKNQGNMTVNTAIWGVSPGFETNDIGFQTGADAAGAHVAWVWKNPNPDRLSRYRQITLAKSWAWNFGKQKVHDGFFTFGNITFPNYWSMFGNLGIFREVKDPQLTRGGPLTANPASHFFFIGMNSDGRKKVSLNLGGNHSSSRSGQWDYSGNVGVEVRLTDSIKISTGPDFSRSRQTAQYVDSTVDAASTRTFGQRYVFADFDQSQVSLTTRGHWILSPKMSLQVFAQPLIAVGRYWDFKQLAQPATYTFQRLAPAAAGVYNPDFNFKSLRVNAVFRWEWKLGSTLYLVWTENRQDFSNPGNFSARRDIGRLFSAKPDDVFLVRFAYWFSR